MINQPQSGQQGWMGHPGGGPAGCPPGLEYLTHVDQIIVKQQVELLEAFTGWEQANKYKIMNSMGQQIYFAAEESGCCMRQCCGANRSFTIHIHDNMSQEVLRVSREFKCCASCCGSWCACIGACSNDVEVTTPNGEVIGKIKQECSFWKPRFRIKTPEGGTVAYINGPCCQCSGPCCPDIKFHVTDSSDTTEIGKICKKWSGVKEIFTDADNFSISFPMDMDVRMKSTFIGALFLIDFMYFEDNNKDNQDHNH